MNDEPKSVLDELERSGHLTAIVKGLGINVPIYAARIVGDRIELTVYGGQTLTWSLVETHKTTAGSAAPPPTTPPRRTRK